MASESKFDERVESALCQNIVAGEYSVALGNQEGKAKDYEAFVDLLDAERGEKDYDWMSDIRLPEFASIMLTQSSTDVNMYFQTRDFVEVYVQDTSEQAIKAAAATKELINRTLNARHLHHYLKFVRAKQIAHLNGCVYFMAWWEQETEEQVVGTQARAEVVKEKGEILKDENGEPVVEIYNADVMGEVTTVDQFNYDVFDPRNVFTDDSYVYSVQEKDWIILRYNKSMEDLESEQETEGYFNLSRLKDQGVVKEETETSRAVENDQNSPSGTSSKTPKWFDIIKRFGKYWAIVDETDEKGRPTKISPGTDEQGNPKEDAEFIEVVMVFALSGNTRTLIAFNPTPYYTVDGKPYKPVGRGLCYPHPAYDSGFGDGKHSAELQYAIDDTFNMTNDRTRLSTIPTFKYKRGSNDDNMDMFFEPGHGIPLDDPVNDLFPIEIRDNIQGGLAQLDQLKGSLQQLTSVYPTTMGNMPANTSTPATAIVSAQNSTNARGNFKNLTFEYTALSELYFFINQMTYTFAKPDTGVKLMGDKVVDFNPGLDYYYKPLSQSSDNEQNKQAKMQKILQIIGFISQIQHPDTLKVVNHFLMKLTELMGDEVESIAGVLFDENTPVQPRGQGQGQGQGGPQGVPQLAGEVPTSNQYGTPQSTGELQTRELMGAVGG